MIAQLARESSFATTAFGRMAELTNRTFVLPVVVFFPTSRCNSRCVSCDWWKCGGEGDLSLAEIAGIADALPGLGTRLVLFSGGEPLLRPDVFQAAARFLDRGLVLHLHTSGVLLERCAADVARTFSRVIVSLDGSTERLYHAVRGVNALAAVERGVAALQHLAPDVPVTARATLHRLNYSDLPRLIEHAKAMGLDGISFLPADVASTAFGRDVPPEREVLALTADETRRFAALVERTIAAHADDFASGFIQESPEKLRRIPQYYRALTGEGRFPDVACNAPYMSAVIEADGSVRPCFFHQTVGSIRREPLEAIVQSNLPDFRNSLVVGSNPVCTRCVCSMKTGWRSAPWD